MGKTMCGKRLSSESIIKRVADDDHWNGKSSRRPEEAKRKFVTNHVCDRQQRLLSLRTRRRARDVPQPSVSEVLAKLKCPQRVRSLLRGICFVLRHHGASIHVLDDAMGQMAEYLCTEDSGAEGEVKFLKRAKDMLTYPMAQFLKNRLPANDTAAGDEPRLVFRGIFLQWLKPRMRKFSKKNVHLFYSLLQCKRSAEPVSEDLVLREFEKHRKAMQIVDPIEDEILGQIMEQLSPVIQKIRKDVNFFSRRITPDNGSVLRSFEDPDPKIREISLSHRCLLRVRPVHQPSFNAAFGSSRNNGGQHGYLTRLMDDFGADGLGQALNFDDLIGMRYHPYAIVGRRRGANICVEVRGKPETTDDWCRAVIKGLVEEERGSIDNRLKAGIEAVIEPFKVRVISKGQACHYFVAKQLQKVIHTSIRNTNWGRLIGRPLCPTDLIDLANNRVNIKGLEHLWLSIDYSAATDNLSAKLSRAIMEGLLQDLPDDMREIYLRVLAPHDIEYPKWTGLDSVRQTNGQLMGSILSFPILCLANLGLYLLTIKDDPRSLAEKLSGVLVNGDDMLYVADEEHFERHSELGRVVGLVNSIGKSYYHRSYANANSTCFWYPLETPNSTPVQIDFMNTGLFFGQHKVLGRHTDVRESAQGESILYPLTSIIPEVINGALPGRQNDVLALYVAEHREEIRQELKGRNIFVSRSLGGAGIIPPADWTYEVNFYQRRLAHAYLQRLVRDGHTVLQSPLNGKIPMEVDLVEQYEMPWLDGRVDPISSLVERPRISNDFLPKDFNFLADYGLLDRRPVPREDQSSMEI